MKRIIIFMTVMCIFFSVISCQEKQMAFNKDGWNESGDGIACPPLRKKMIADLLQNHKLKGLTCNQLREKLGTPQINEQWDENTISYEIVVDYGWDIDPVYIKTLDFYYNKDSIITFWKIKEFQKKIL